MELERSLAHYIKGTEDMKSMVEGKSGLKIPECALHAWRNMFVAMRFVDYYIDNSNDLSSRSKLGQEVIGFLSSRDSFSLSLDPRCTAALANLRDDIALLGEDKKKSFLSGVSLALKVGEKKKHAGNPRELTRLTRLEGQITSRLFFHFLPDEFKKGNFPKWFRTLGRVGSLYDSLVDWEDDYRKQETTIKPSLSNKALAIAQTRNDFWYLLRYSPLSLWKTPIKSATKFAKDRSSLKVSPHSPRQ